MDDLDAYLRRIGLGNGAKPTLAQVHRGQASTIVFENLDPHCGLTVSLASEDLERKLVAQRRGGYCFEQNMLLKDALEALGAQVELFLARVRYRAEPGVVRPRTHLVMGVQMEGERWLADVGFGLGTLLEPLPFAPGVEVEQSGWRFALREEGDELVVAQLEGGEWVDLYGFVPRPDLAIDVEINNWWVSTHPRSPFVTGIAVGVYDAAGVHMGLRDWSGEPVLMRSEPDGAREETALAREELPAVLAERFDLRGFALDADGRRLVRAEG
jgi:N-hydroxyarylamine O-acetyltransferase